MSEDKKWYILEYPLMFRVEHGANDDDVEDNITIIYIIKAGNNNNNNILYRQTQ